MRKNVIHIGMLLNTDSYLLHCFDVLPTQIKTDRRKSPLFGREQQRTVAKADIEPAAAFDILGHFLDHVAETFRCSSKFASGMWCVKVFSKMIAETSGKKYPSVNT